LLSDNDDGQTINIGLEKRKHILYLIQWAIFAFGFHMIAFHISINLTATQIVVLS
jgi:hypothetical protein